MIQQVFQKKLKEIENLLLNGRNISTCKKLERWPYVCTSCSKRYSSSCNFAKYIYDVKYAQTNADINLIDSRRGIDVDSDEFKQLDNLIKNGVEHHESIYQIKINNNSVIKKSLTTIYRYINNGYLKTSILTFILPTLQLSILDIISKPDSSKVVKFFDDLENSVGTETFKELFPVILTDRDPAFSDFNGICYSKITGEERCKLFYCDPYVSNQKPNVENMNKQLRLFFPKGKSINKYTKKDIKNINITLLNKPLKSLDGNSPKDAFTKIFGNELLNKIF